MKQYGHEEKDYEPDERRIVRAILVFLYCVAWAFFCLGCYLARLALN